MITMKKLVIGFFALVFLPTNGVQAQEKRKADSLEGRAYYNRSFFRAGLQYNSDWVYTGRKDSLAVPYITPSIGYYDRSGFFLKGFMSYLTASTQQRIDMFGAMAGYVWIKKDLYVGGSGTVWLFNDSSYAVQSTAGGNINAYMGYDFGLVDLTVDATTLFSNSTDILLGLELSRFFYAANDRLKISPSVYVTWGTQSYYNEYYNTKRTGMRGRHGSGQGGSTQTIVEVGETSKFQLLAYEFSLPVSYSLKAFRFSFTPSFVIPQNPSIITIDQTSYPEELENTFYWSAGFSYKF